MRTADLGECKCTKTWAPVAVTCRVCADVSKSNNICGVPGHPDPATCSLLPVLQVPVLQVHVAQARHSSLVEVWGLLCGP